MVFSFTVLILNLLICSRLFVSVTVNRIPRGPLQGSIGCREPFSSLGASKNKQNKLQNNTAVIPSRQPRYSTNSSSPQGWGPYPIGPCNEQQFALLDWLS